MTQLIQGIDYTVDGAGNYTLAAFAGRTVFISYQQNVATAAASALGQLGLSLAPGYLGQGVWGYLASNYPGQALGYSGLAYLYAPSYALGSAAEVPNHSFEVSTPWEQSFTVDADPGAVITDILTNDRYGANFPTSRLGSLAALTLYARAQGLQMSPALTVQKPAADWLRYLLDMCNSDCTWSQAQLKFVPLGDAAVSGNGVLYTPNTTPAYDLTEDHFIVTSAAQDGVQVQRKSNEECFNHVRVEYTNRYNQYNTEIVEAKDAADISVRGVRTMATLEAHAVCEPAAARALATLALGRLIAVRNTYKFTLPWVYGLLEPLDLLTLTYAPKGMVRTPVRVNKVTELDTGDFEFECEDAPVGQATAPAYGVQAGLGFAHDYNAAPGNVTTPTFFEAPVERTTTGLEVYAAVSGPAAIWGGCSVWSSLDGLNYKKTGRIAGGSRYGTLTAGMLLADTTVALQLSGLGGQLLSGTLADAQTLSTLLWIDGAQDGGEYLSYQGATLTGANAYTLGGVLHSAFGTTQQAHASGARWARVDKALASSGPLDIGLIGKTVYFKFTSFNVYGGAEQQLQDVTPYSYAITGGLAKLPPPNFDSFTLNIQPDGTRQFTFSYSVTRRPADFLGAQIRYLPGTVASPVWASMRRLDDLPDNGFYSQSPVETNALISGAYTFALCAIDTTYNASKTPLLIQATLPNRRLGNVLDEFSEYAEGWTGAKTGCAVVNGFLEAIDPTTWGTTPATWAPWTRWNFAPTSPIVYVGPVRDLGVSVGFTLNSDVDADGTVFQESRVSSVSSADLLTQPWVNAGSAVTGRFMQARITLTATGPAPVPLLRSWIYRVNATVKKEYINDAVISTYTGAQRIGVGDIRIPLGLTYATIKRVSIIVQDSTATAWTYALLDKSLTGPRVQFRANGVLADPAKVDFYIEGA